MRKKTLLILVFLLAITAAFFLYKKSDKPKFESDPNVLEVRLEVDAPFTNAWLTLNANFIEYITEDTTGPEVTYSHRVLGMEDEDMELLKNKISESGFWLLEHAYEDKNMMDATKYTLGVKLASESTGLNIKEVTCYAACPEELLNIVGFIEEILGFEILNVGV